MGAGPAAKTVLRRDGRSATAGLGPHHLADPARDGRQPRQQGIGAGAKLYLPVFVPGALFSCGDGHGVQGDGEVCVTAIETALQGRFRLTLRKDLRLNYPRAETQTHYMTMAMDPDLDQCVVRALRDMIVLLGEKRNLSREDAYTLCSLAADLRVTQTVNGSKGIHCMIEKAVVHG
jgi:acetamidase/formamidase